MAAMVRVLGILLVLAAAGLVRAAIDGCGCDPDEAATMEARQCSLSREALAQPPVPAVFFLKDINPSKPNRWLALPRAVRKTVHTLGDMTPQERLEFWTAAIRKGREMWGDQWGLAFNGEEVRTQCQPHLHVGKFLPAAESDGFTVVDGPAHIPIPKDSGGVWVHAVGDKLHVHLGESLTETVLLR
jgi:hypothetical protein